MTDQNEFSIKEPLKFKMNDGNQLAEGNGVMPDLMFDRRRREKLAKQIQKDIDLQTLSSTRKTVE